MKIILSRKGFDTANGGFPSPILPDGRMLSLPIPSSDNIHYSDLRVGEYGTYFDLMLNLKDKIKYQKQWHDLNKNTRCHLDPDVYKDIFPRKKGWKPIFGQIDAALTHLENEGVKPDDLFLFFGTFRKTFDQGHELRFDPHEKPKHIIFGYLQIGEILKVDEKLKCPKWMEYHPHACDHRRKKKNNTIYVARDTLSWNSRMKGAGAFMFDKSLVLTKEDCSLTKWDLNEIFRNVKISCHSDKNWKKEGYFDSNDIGQEFVVHADKNSEKWVKDLLRKAKIANA